MDLEHVKRLLEIANNELSQVEEMHNNLHREVVNLTLKFMNFIFLFLSVYFDYTVWTAACFDFGLESVESSCYFSVML